jgi:hypothetical protein
MIVGRTSSILEASFSSPFGIVDLRAEPDREHLPAAMLIGMACRKEGEEDLVAQPEVVGDHVDAAFDIVQHRAVMLHHAARRAAGSARVDDAGEILAREGRAGGAGVHVRRLAAMSAFQSCKLMLDWPLRNGSIPITCSQLFDGAPAAALRKLLVETNCARRRYPPGCG